MRADEYRRLVELLPVELGREHSMAEAVQADALCGTTTMTWIVAGKCAAWLAANGHTDNESYVAGSFVQHIKRYALRNGRRARYSKAVKPKLP